MKIKYRKNEYSSQYGFFNPKKKGSIIGRDIYPLYTKDFIALFQQLKTTNIAFSYVF